MKQKTSDKSIKIDVDKLNGEFVLETGKAEHALDNFLMCLSNEYPDVLEKSKAEYKKGVSSLRTIRTYRTRRSYAPFV